MARAVKDRERTGADGARLVVLGLTAGTAVALIGYATEVNLATVALMLFHVAALTALLSAWQRANAAAEAASQNAQDLDRLAGRLARLEKLAHIPSPPSPVLRSTMAEVTGTVGLLGGVVRELARNVAAQNRDVADIRDSLGQGQGTREAAPSLPAAVPVLRSPQPEPSLLPVRPPQSESDLRRARLVTHAFEADGVELHLQPIVALPKRNVRFYEALARLRLDDGAILAPSEFLPHIERIGRAPEFDRRVVTRAIMIARHLVQRGSEAIVTVNLSHRSVRDARFIESLALIAAEAPDIAGKVVLEIPQSCWRNLDSRQKGALKALGLSGLHLSLDQAPDLQFDALALAENGVRFLKLPAEMLIAAAQGDGEADVSVRDFTPMLRKAGIRLIADRVENEDMVPALVELGVPLAQGFAFAAPRAVRAEVLGLGTEVKAGELRRAG